MRIVYVQLSPTFGMHQYAADLANRMAGLHDVHVLTTKSFPADRYSSKTMVHAPVLVPDTGLSANCLRLKDLYTIVQKLRGLGADVVHFTGPHLWNPILIWALRRQCPVIHTLHDFTAHPGAGYGRLLGAWNKFVLAAADHIVVHGWQYRQKLIAQGMAPKDVTHLPLLHLCFSHQMTVDLVKSREPNRVLAEDAPFLFFGRVEPYKGVEVLLDAHRRLADQGQRTGLTPPPLVIAGAGELTGNAATALPEDVTWHNRQIADEEALRLFKTCRAVVLPYVEASQSAIVGTAYFFGKPVLATEAGALPEYVRNGETGIVVESGNPDALAGALARLAWSPSRVRRMGKAARQWYDRQRGSEYEALLVLYEVVVGN